MCWSAKKEGKASLSRHELENRNMPWASGLHATSTLLGVWVLQEGLELLSSAPKELAYPAHLKNCLYLPSGNII